MRVKLKHKNEVHELKIEQARFFENLKEDEVEVEFFEDVFLDLNLGMCLELLEKYDLKYLTQGLLYFGFENMLEKISDFLQTKEIEDFFEKHIEKVNWTCLSGNPSLSETFFEKHIKDVNWESLSGNPSLSEAFFEKHIKDVNWESLSKNPSLSEAFFEKHIKNVLWGNIEENPSISEAFFEKHKDKVDWMFLPLNSSMSEIFFERHIDTSEPKYKVYWPCLSANPSLSEAFFEKHIDKVDWLALSRNPSLSEAFFEKYIDKVNWPGLSRNPSLSEVFFEKYLDTSGEAGQKCKVNWSCLSENLSLSEAFFERHIEDVDWLFLSTNPSMSEDFFERHVEDVDWKGIFRNPSMSENFFERHIEDVNWVSLSRVPLSVVFFERHVENVYWWVLSSNCFSRVPWRKFLKIEFSDFSTIVIHRASSELNEKSVDFSATSLQPLYYRITVENEMVNVIDMHGITVDMLTQNTELLLRAHQTYFRTLVKWPIIQKLDTKKSKAWRIFKEMTYRDAAKMISSHEKLPVFCFSRRGIPPEYCLVNDGSNHVLAMSSKKSRDFSMWKHCDILLAAVDSTAQMSCIDADIGKRPVSRIMSTAWTLLAIFLRACEERETDVYPNVVFQAALQYEILCNWGDKLPLISPELSHIVLLAHAAGCGDPQMTAAYSDLITAAMHI